MSKQNMRFRNGILILSGLVLAVPFVTSHVHAADKRPALVIKNTSVPNEIKQNIYSKPARVRDITAADVSGEQYYQPTNTVVSGKIEGLFNDLKSLQRKVGLLSSNMRTLQESNDEGSAEYYAAIATVNTQLQSGTTPGNPRLVEKLNKANLVIEDMTDNVNELNRLGSSASGVSSEAAFLVENIQAAYNVSGAIEEDHVNLTKLEDATNATIVTIERVLNIINSDIIRSSAYLSTERQNLRALSLAVAKGDLYGNSLSNKSFSNNPVVPAAAEYGGYTGTVNVAPSSRMPQSAMNAQPLQAAPLSGPRPLVKIRFDRPDVNYEQPIYMAVNEALERYPNAQFDLIAVHPSNGNAAKMAIESTRARRNAENVLRTITQMGLSPDRVTLSQNQSPDAQSSEVHLFIR